MSDQFLTKPGHDSTSQTDESATQELTNSTGPSMSFRGEDAGEDTKDESDQSRIGRSADQENAGLDQSGSTTAVDGGNESSDMDRSESAMSTEENEPELRSSSRIAKSDKPKFKSKDRSIPVAVIQTDGLQDEIQGMIDSLSSTFNKSSTEITAKVDEILRRIDDLEMVLR
ncbi:hypothetical protein V1509DRAFT_324455 [Lipomyces kononenkoae]